MDKYDGWIVKNKWGSFLEWTVSSHKKGVIKIIGKETWVAWRKFGHNIVKIKFVEVA